MMVPDEIKDNLVDAIYACLLYTSYLAGYIIRVFDGKPFVLTGNYPYNISSQIFFKMLDYKDLIPCCTGMIQKEVAERIAAGPGSKTYGILSILIQAWYKVEYLFTVHEHVFNPPHKVKSAVIRMTPVSYTHLGTAPTSCPKRASTWFTLSIRKVCFPCSNSRTKRSPTPALAAKSTCVSPNRLRISFTNNDNESLIITPFRVQI